MRRVMKVLQIERVVPDLIDRTTLKLVFPYLELDYEHEMVEDYCNVHSTPKARQFEL